MTNIPLVKYQAIFTTHNGLNVFRVNVKAKSLTDAKTVMRFKLIEDKQNGFNRDGYRLNSVTIEGSKFAVQALADAHKMALTPLPVTV